MRSFKHFITENKISLSQHPDALGIHMKYHSAGIPLPDREDLYQAYVGGPVRYPKSNGGYIEHRLDDLSITHYNREGVPHNEDGPASISLHGTLKPKIWALNGNSVGEHREFTYGDGTKLHSFFTHHHHTDRTGGWSSREVNTLGEFNAHLAKHGLPPHKVEE